MTSLCGRVPVRGEIVGGHDTFDFEILDADPRRVKRIRIHRRDAVANDGRDAGENVMAGVSPAADLPATARPGLDPT